MGRLLYFIHRISCSCTLNTPQSKHIFVSIKPVAAGARKVFVADRARLYVCICMVGYAAIIYIF